MNSLQWLEVVAPSASNGAVADRAGISRATLNRQVERGQLSPEVAVAVARAYDVPVLPGLVAVGLISEEEAGLKDRMGLEEALRSVDDHGLIAEVLRRVDGGAGLHEMLHSPLDEEHPGLILVEAADDPDAEYTDGQL